MNRYPAKPMMDEMAKYGRYGDSMLVHMHPAEVAGIASLVPGGLTRNPVTGQPEAFAFLAPMLLGAAGVSLSPLAAAAVTGGVSAIINKDLGKGALDAITGFASGALGEGLGELLGTAGDAATQTVTTLGTDAAKTGVDAGLEAATTAAATNAASAVSDLGFQTAQAGAKALEGAKAAGTLEAGIERAIAGPTALNIDPTKSLSAQIGTFSNPGTAFRPMDINKMVPSDITGKAMSSYTPPPLTAEPPLSLTQRINEGIRGVGTMGQLGIAGVAQGAKGDMEMREAARAQAEALRAEGEASRAESRADLNRAYAVARPDIPVGIDYDTRRSEMSRRTAGLLPMGAAGGGQVQKMDKGGKTYSEDLVAARDIYRFMGGPRGYGGRDATAIQKGLRGQDIIAPPKDFMPGFEPEFQYFQDLARDPDGNIVGTPDVPDRSYRPMRQGVISRSQYFDPILQAPQSNAQMNEYRRTLEKLDPGPLDEASVMGLASEGSVLSPMQQNMFQQYAPLAPFSMAQRDRLTELTDRGMSLEEAIQNQETSRVKGFDKDGDGVVSDAEYAEATAEPEEPEVPEYMAGMSAEERARLAEYLDSLGIDSQGIITSLMTAGGLGSIFNYMNKGGETEGKKMPEVGPAPEPQVGPPPTGGDIPIRTSMMEGTVPDGGIARVPTEFTQQGDPMKAEVDRDMAALKAVVRGDIEDDRVKDEIIQGFIAKYGQEAYELARQTFLSQMPQESMAMMSMGGMATQTQGLLQGPGSGMDDMIPGMIGSSQPVAVSPGEYIVAADVVSGLGEGSSEAGAKELDKMMDRVRMARNGTTEQAPRINERKVMPA